MTDLNADLLFGAPAIAEFVGVDVRKVYHWMDRRKTGKDAPPVFDVGGQVCARRSELSSWFSGFRNLSSQRAHTVGFTGSENSAPGVILGNSHHGAETTLNTYDQKSEQVEEVRE